MGVFLLVRLQLIEIEGELSRERKTERSMAGQYKHYLITFPRSGGLTAQKGK